MDDRTLQTAQGPVRGRVGREAGSLSCIPESAASLMTRCGRLEVRDELDPPRFPNVPAVWAYPDGQLRSVVLARATEMATSVGMLTAEKLTFHRDGSLRRLFPLAGKTSAYWSEKQEGELCPVLQLATPVGRVSGKFVSVLFWPNGALRSFSLWPETSVSIHTPVGEIACRYGVSFHSSGALRSVEPLRPTSVTTPIGRIVAYDGMAIGIHGEDGSLRFDEHGSVCQVRTESTRVDITSSDGKTHSCAPTLVASTCSDEDTEWSPLSVTLTPEALQVSGQSFPLTGCVVTTHDGGPAPERRLPMC